MLGKFVKDMALYSPAQFLPAITAFITTPILTRLFAPAEYGSWALAAGISAFLVALAVSGLGSSAIRFYPVYKAESSLNVFFATISITTGVIIIVVAVASVFILNLIKDFLPSTLYRLLPIVILIFIAQSVFTVFTSVMRAQGKSGSYTSFQLFINYGGLAIGLTLVLIWGLQINGLLWGSFISIILALPFLIYKATKQTGIHPNDFNFIDARNLWYFAWPLALGNVAMWGLRMSDLYIISMFKTEHEVGLYTVSYNISSKSIELLVSLFLLSVSPLIMRTWEDKGREATESALTMVTRVYLILCLPAAIGLSVLAFPFVNLLTTPDYYEGYKIVGFVAFSSFLWGLSNIAMMGTVIKKQTLRLGANQIIAASTHIGLAILLVPRIGYIAAAITTLIGYTVLLTLQTLSSHPNLKWAFPFKTLSRVLISSAIMGFICWGVYNGLGVRSGHSTVYLFISVGAGVVIYLVCLWALGEVDGEEKDIVKQFWHKLAERTA